MLAVFMKSLIWPSIALKHNFRVFQLPWMRDHYKFFSIDLEKNLLIIIKKSNLTIVTMLNIFEDFNCEISLLFSHLC